MDFDKIGKPNSYSAGTRQVLCGSIGFELILETKQVWHEPSPPAQAAKCWKSGKHTKLVTHCSFPMFSGFGTCALHDQGVGHNNVRKMRYQTKWNDMLVSVAMEHKTEPIFGSNTGMKTRVIANIDQTYKTLSKSSVFFASFKAGCSFDLPGTPRLSLHSPSLCLAIGEWTTQQKLRLIKPFGMHQFAFVVLWVRAICVR